MNDETTKEIVDQKVSEEIKVEQPKQATADLNNLFIIPRDSLQGIVNYLATKPYNEVRDAMELLLKLPTLAQFLKKG